MFRDQVVAALHAVVDRAEWPAEGLPMAERESATAGLDAKLVELEHEQESLRAQAAELGLNVSKAQPAPPQPIDQCRSPGGRSGQGHTV